MRSEAVARAARERSEHERETPPRSATGLRPTRARSQPVVSSAAPNTTPKRTHQIATVE